MVSDLFVADESDAPAVSQAKPPAKKWAALFAPDLDEGKLRHLWELVRADSKKPSPALRMVHSAAKSGPWVYAVPGLLVERVAALNDNGVDRTAEAWATAEAFRLDGWQQPDVREALVGLRAVCRKARASGKVVLLRMGS